MKTRLPKPNPQTIASTIRKGFSTIRFGPRKPTVGEVATSLKEFTELLRTQIRDLNKKIQREPSNKEHAARKKQLSAELRAAQEELAKLRVRGMKKASK